MDIYYGLWAQIRNWTVDQRAILVVALFCIVLTGVMKLVGFRIIAVIAWGADLILKAIFRTISGSFKIQVNDKSIRRWNSICDKFEKISDFLEKQKSQLCQPQKKIFKKIVLLYIILIVCIIVPGHLGDIVEGRYLDGISSVRRLYIRLEEIPLEKSEQFAPLIKTEEKSDENERLLKLSEKGIAGSNVRTEPNKESTPVTVISGEVQMTYIREQNGWIYVRLSDGTEGWIRDYLVEEAG